MEQQDPTPQELGRDTWTVVSRHLTSDGVVVYRRHESGAVDMQLVPYDVAARALVANTAA